MERKPTLNDRVLFYPSPTLPVPHPEPKGASIVRIWTPSCVNLQCDDGEMPTSVLLITYDGAPRPMGYYCEFAGAVKVADVPVPAPSMFSTGPAAAGSAAVVSPLVTSETTYPASGTVAAVTEPFGTVTEVPRTAPLFAFALKQVVRIAASKECGTVEGRAEFSTSEPSYFIRYCGADGSARETWWSESALAAA